MLRDKLKNYKLVLASGSPRRQQFMRDLDVDFEVRLKDVEEAQQYIVNVAKDLESRGELVLANGNSAEDAMVF